MVAEPLVKHAGSTETFREPAIHLGHYLVDALTERGLDVVAPHDTAALFASQDLQGGWHRNASAFARIASKQFGVDGVLVVELLRWSERSAGSQTEKRRGATVAFRVTLHGGRHGFVKWNGEFDETQRRITEYPFSALRLPGRGMRRLTVMELARWGAREVARDMPLTQ